MSDEITETVSREGWERREVFRQFGVAIYFCQVLEFELVTYALLIRRARLGRPMTDLEATALRERLLAATFGGNFGEVNNLLEGKWVLSDQMKAAVELRNDLVHHWMRNRKDGFDASASRVAMIEELRTVVQSLQDVVDVVISRIAGFMTSVGVLRKQIEVEFGRVLRQSGEGG